MKKKQREYILMNEKNNEKKNKKRYIKINQMK